MEEENNLNNSESEVQNLGDNSGEAGAVSSELGTPASGETSSKLIIIIAIVVIAVVILVGVFALSQSQPAEEVFKPAVLPDLSEPEAVDLSHLDFDLVTAKTELGGVVDDLFNEAKEGGYLSDTTSLEEAYQTLQNLVAEGTISVPGADQSGYEYQIASVLIHEEITARIEGKTLRPGDIATIMAKFSEAE